MIWVIWSLFMCTLISITSQGAASYFSPTFSRGSSRAGHILLQVSMVLQLILDICFIGILAVFQRRCARDKVFDANKSGRARTVMLVLYGLAALLLVVFVFRTAQIFSAFSSPVWRTEVFFWVFDAAPLLLCTSVLNLAYPARLLQE